MADSMTCPLCGNDHPAGTTWCPVNWADIPTLQASPGTPATQEVVCSSCGDSGQPGQPCRQCGDTLPSGPTTTADPVFVRLPSGRQVALPRGQEIAIGRDSQVAEIADGLEPFDTVSRRHCYVLIDPTGDRVTVRDPGSINHTWVGDNPHELAETETRTVPLPVTIRLGQRLAVTLSREGARR